ncbi:MAG: hydrogenase maturation nickel metallochaperone HypA [Gammaproteobacteria bacterium]|nr:MAG: hydrogenase maturation nickel metallochaperone HypA [Gammaproteobacteria bacterium]
MHEFSLCRALLRQVEQVAREHGARRVDRIELRLGPLSGAEAALLRQAWPLAAAGTLAAAAELVIEPAPVVVRCTACGAETEAAPNRLLCGACGDWRTRLVSGDELLLAQLELSDFEMEEAAPCASPSP